MKNILLTISLPLSLVAIVLLSKYYFEDVKNHYSNYEELISSNLEARGWMSKDLRLFLPKSATDIHERHNIDTNRVDMHFKFNFEEANHPQSICTELERNTKGIKYVCSSDEGRTSILTLRKDGVGYFHSEEDGLSY